MKQRGIRPIMKPCMQRFLLCNLRFVTSIFGSLHRQALCTRPHHIQIRAVPLFSKRGLQIRNKQTKQNFHCKCPQDEKAMFGAIPLKPCSESQMGPHRCDQNHSRSHLHTWLGICRSLLRVHLPIQAPLPHGGH